MNKPLKRILAVVFDMDGLMFNTEDLYDKVGSILLARRQLSFTHELKMQMMGLPGPKAFQVMKDVCRLSDSVETLQRETDEIFVELLPREIGMLPGLEALLDEIERLGLRKAVATSSHAEFARSAIGQFDLHRRFEFVLTSDDVTNGKPDPEVYLLAAKRFNISTSQMVVLEDSLIGSTAAAASGAVTVAVPGEHSRDGNFDHVNFVADRLDSPAIFDLIKS